MAIETQYIRFINTAIRLIELRSYWEMAAFEAGLDVVRVAPATWRGRVLGLSMRCKGADAKQLAIEYWRRVTGELLENDEAEAACIGLHVSWTAGV